MGGPGCGSASDESGAEASLAIRADLAGLAGVLAGGTLITLLCAILGVVSALLRRVASSLVVALLVRRSAVRGLARRRGVVAGLGRVGGVAGLLRGTRLIASVLGRSVVALVRLGVLLLEAHVSMLARRERIARE